MSGINIKDLMDELSAGEEARKRIPEYVAAANQAGKTISQLSEHNQQLELRAKDREDQISKLLERIRTAEHERDDALMASLEADEKLKSFRGTVDKFSSAVASALSGVGAANALLDPPKAVQPTPAPEPVKEPEGNVSGTSNQSGQSGNEQPSHGAGQSEGNQGQSEMGNASSNTPASSPQPNGQTTGSTDYSSRQEGSGQQGESAASPTVTQQDASKSSDVTHMDASQANEPNPPVDTRPWWEEEGQRYI